MTPMKYTCQNLQAVLGAPLTFQSSERDLVALRVHRLDQVIARPELEGLERVVGEGRDENRAGGGREEGLELQTGAARHFHIQKHHVRRVQRQQGARFLHSAGHSDDFHLPVLREQGGQCDPRQGLIVHNQGFNPSIHLSKF